MFYKSAPVIFVALLALAMICMPIITVFSFIFNWGFLTNMVLVMACIADYIIILRCLYYIVEDIEEEL